jgi:tetratricopeptide (TPR) repeat protein
MARKRKRNHQEVKEGISGVLKGISQRVGKKKFAEALTLMDKTAAQEKLSASRQCQLVALAGDIEFKQGKFNSASEIYQRAEDLAQGNNRVWFRAVVGQVRSLLKEIRTSEAYDITAKAWIKVVEKYEAHQQEIKEVQLKLQQNGGGVWVVKERPYRPSVIGARLGQLFFQEGEIESAKDFFLKAIDYNPQGGCRARVGLARIALRETNFLEALLRANQALVMGKLSAKTLCAWPLYLTARQRLGQKSIEPDLLNTLNKSNLKGVRARAILNIVKTLRSYHDASWQTIAQNWLSEEGEAFPIIAAELRKLFLSEAKLSSLASQQIQVADALLGTENLSANEYLSAVKAKLKAQLEQGETLELNNWIAQSTKIYGSDFAAKLRHGLAIVLWRGQQLELASTLLEQNFKTLTRKASQWGKSTWSLAQLKEDQKDNLKAAEYFDLVAKEQSVPLRFRLQATINWVSCLVASGQTDVIVKAKEEILATVNQIEDWELLLNLARHLLKIAKDKIVMELRREIIAQGEALAWKAFQNAAHPSIALDILFKLIRRQVCDLTHPLQAVGQWESLPETKRNWLWSEKAIFWEMLSLIYTAYIRLKRESEAEKLALNYLQDPATPSEGVALLGITHAKTLVKKEGRQKEALSWFTQISQEIPTHWKCAHAYYWLALVAWEKGDMTQAQTQAKRIQQALGTRQLGLAEEWNLYCRSELLLNGLDTEKVFQQQSLSYREEFVEWAAKSIQNDLEVLP